MVKDAEIEFEKNLDKKAIVELLNQIQFRGLYGKDGKNLKPYGNAKFSLVTIHPPMSPTSFPQIEIGKEKSPLFTAQPTIYKTQTETMKKVDEFLKTLKKRLHKLDFEGVQYYWKGKGRFHVLPPVVERHTIPLKNGVFDVDKLLDRFVGCYVRDARGNLHDMSKKTIREFYVDNDSRVNYMDVFNHSVELINYGLRFNGPFDFNIICDGSHRIDYALEVLDEPIQAILVEGDPLIPYYALPVPFRPTTRLTSKDAEKMYPKLERDKIHLLNDFIKKVLHYDWEAGGLHVSKLRGAARIH